MTLVPLMVWDIDVSKKMFMYTISNYIFNTCPSIIVVIDYHLPLFMLSYSRSDENTKPR